MRKRDKNKTNHKKKKYIRPTLRKHKPLREIVLLTGAVVGSSVATFGAT